MAPGTGLGTPAPGHVHQVGRPKRGCASSKASSMFRSHFTSRRCCHIARNHSLARDPITRRQQCPWKNPWPQIWRRRQTHRPSAVRHPGVLHETRQRGRGAKRRPCQEAKRRSSQPLWQRPKVPWRVAWISRRTAKRPSVQPKKTSAGEEGRDQGDERHQALQAQMRSLAAESEGSDGGRLAP